MSEPGKDTSLTHGVRWDREDFRRIEEAVEKLNRDEHLDLNAADVIRKAVRLFCEEVLGPVEKSAA